MAIELIDTIKPKNNGSFPLVEAEDVLMPDGKRLHEYQFTPGTEGSEEITVTVDVLPETTYEGFALNGAVGAHMYEVAPAPFSLAVGETYTVVWDGESHTCVAQDASVVLFGYVALGNASIVDLDGNEEPFLIAASPEEVLYISLTDTEAGGSHTVRIYQTTTTVIQTSTAVPSVSAADNGKIYQVVDGKMAAVPLGDSAVKTYIDDYINEALGGDY